MNKVFLTGKIERECESKTWGDNKEFVRFSIKVENGKYYDYFNVTSFKKVDDLKSLKKGDLVLISGELRKESYEKDGVTHRDVSINLDTFELLGIGTKEETIQDILLNDTELPF